MDTYTFNDILARLPGCDRFPTQESLPNGVRYVDMKLDSFIPPDLSDGPEGGESDGPQVLIISAAGAVGKSTLAEAIAYEKGALLLNLASAKEVGNDTLDGIIFNTIATGLTDEYFEYLSAGLQFLIIDALDEGRIKVNEASFRRLLENVSKRARNATGVCFILLGRTRIAEEAWLVLTEEKIRASILSIEPFNRCQANKYIANRLGDDQKTPPYCDCRDLIFAQLESSATAGAELAATKEFVHYPPVLDVVATLLKDEKNPMQLKNSLAGQDFATQGKPVDLLQEVITRILKREQEEKVLPAIRQSIGERARQQGWSNWDSLYSTEEQCKRLLGSVFQVPVHVVFEGLPDDIRSDYEDSVNSSLDEHPFLQTSGKFANPVFQSYLHAKALLGDFGDDLKSIITKELLSRQLLPTGLLAEFYLSSGSTEGTSKMTIAPEHLGILYDSLLSSESNRSHVRLNVDGPDPMDDDDSEESGPIEGEFEILVLAPNGNSDIERSIPFSMEVDKDSEIRFPRYLRDAFITVPCTIILGKMPPILKLVQTSKSTPVISKSGQNL